jgi:hypothetical protein
MQQVFLRDRKKRSRYRGDDNHKGTHEDDPSFPLKLWPYRVELRHSPQRLNSDDFWLSPLAIFVSLGSVMGTVPG